jgi:predicted peptidase
MYPRPINWFFLLLALSAAASCKPPEADQSPSLDELLRISFNSIETNAEKDFFLYLPTGYYDQPEKKWPVILFLHGNGERGNSKDELDFVLIHGPMYEAWVQRKELPFVIISPQLPMFGLDTMGVSYLVDRNPATIPERLQQGTPERSSPSRSDQPMQGFETPSVEQLNLPPLGWEMIEQDLITLIDKVKSEFRVDPGRLYLTGLSYGGFGTWYMASKYPDLFAAASPVVGWGHPDLMQPIAQYNLPLWVFSGGRDPVVEKKFFLPGLNKLEELGHTNLRYTIHDDMGHDTWKRVYAGDDLYNWFLEQQL